MSKYLIPLQESKIDQQLVQTVDARELHEFLESKQDFSTWIKNRIKHYNFQENQDFICFHKKMEANNATLIEYHLTLEMAKELSMVERNEKGRQARQYFIECERQAKNPDLSTVLSDPQHLRGLLSNYTEKVIELEQKVEILEPKAKALDHLTRADGTMCITDAAKALEVRPKDLFAYMLQNSWVYRRQGGGSLIPYQDKIQRGLLDCSTTTVYRSDGTEKITTQTRVTPKGLALLEQNYKELVV